MWEGGPKRSRFVLKKQPSLWPSCHILKTKTTLCKAIAYHWFTHSLVSWLLYVMHVMYHSFFNRLHFYLENGDNLFLLTLAPTYQIIYQNIALLIVTAMRSSNLTWWAVATHCSCAPLIWSLATIFVLTFNHTTVIFFQLLIS